MNEQIDLVDAVCIDIVCSVLFHFPLCSFSWADSGRNTMLFNRCFVDTIEHGPFKIAPATPCLRRSAAAIGVGMEQLGELHCWLHRELRSRLRS